MADTPDLGSGASAWGFKSPLPHSLFPIIFCTVLFGCSPTQEKLVAPSVSTEQSWLEWIAYHDKKFSDFKKENLPAIRNYLSRYRLQEEDRVEAPIRLQNASVSFERIPGERLPRIRFFGPTSREARESVSLDTVPDGYEPDLVRISESEQRVAIIFKNGEQRLLCLFERSSNESVCRDTTLYDIVWDNDNKTLIATRLNKDTVDLLQFDTLTGSEKLLLPFDKSVGYLLLKKTDGKITFHTSKQKQWYYFSEHDRVPRPLKEPLSFAHKDCSTTYEEFIPSYDGALIPVRRHGGKEHPRAIVLQFYGAYGKSLPEKLSSHLEPYLDDNIMIADLALRGGGECGEEWQNAGAGILKKNTAEDLKAAVRYFSDLYPNVPLILLTRSAGGIPAGIALSEETERIRGAVLEAPFLAIDLWMGSTDGKDESDLWGDPTTPEGRQALNELNTRLNGSSVHTTVPVFVWIGGKDTVIPIDWIRPWIVHVAKNATVRVDPDATHDGPVNTAETAQLYAEEYAFIRDISNESF